MSFNSSGTIVVFQGQYHVLVVTQLGSCQRTVFCSSLARVPCILQPRLCAIAWPLQMTSPLRPPDVVNGVKDVYWPGDIEMALESPPKSSQVRTVPEDVISCLELSGTAHIDCEPILGYFIH